jgi:hypothetical protein
MRLARSSSFARRIILATAIVIAACDQPAFDPPDWLDWGGITVSVSDDRGHALANLRVEIVHHASHRTRASNTGGDGTTSFAQIESGPWSVRALAPPGHLAGADSAVATVREREAAAVSLTFPANWQELTGELNVSPHGNNFRPCGEASWWYLGFLDSRLRDPIQFRWNELIRQGGTPIWATLEGYPRPNIADPSETVFVVDSVIDMMPKPAYRCP